MRGMTARGVLAAGLAAGILAGVLATTAGAQDEPTESDAAVDAIVQPFGQWALRCATAESTAPCDIVQILTDRESGAPVVSMSLAYSAEDLITAVQVVAPLGVHLPSGLKLAVGDLDPPSAPYARCELQGCYVEVRLAEEALAQMRIAPLLTLTFAIAPERMVSIEMGLEGFPEAYDALVAEMTARSTPE